MDHVLACVIHFQLLSFQPLSREQQLETAEDQMQCSKISSVDQVAPKPKAMPKKGKKKEEPAQLQPTEHASIDDEPHEEQVENEEQVQQAELKQGELTTAGEQDEDSDSTTPRACWITEQFSITDFDRLRELNSDEFVRTG